MSDVPLPLKKQIIILFHDNCLMLKGEQKQNKSEKLKTHYGT